MVQTSYHHGNLREAALADVARVIAHEGVGAVSLRSVARSAHVSHGALAHHFGDRRGLFTALAAEGFGILAEVIHAQSGPFLEVAVAYVRFARQHPGHYTVMFDSSLISPGDADFRAAAAQASQALADGIATLGDSGSNEDPAAAGLAAFSMVHGFAMLYLNDSLPTHLVPAGCSEDELDEIVRRTGRMLFSG